MKRPNEWHGSISLDGDCALFVGSGGRVPVHRHLAYKLVAGLDGDAEVASARHGRRRAALTLIRPNEQHAVDTSGAPAALLYVEPTSDWARRLAACDEASLASRATIAAVRDLCAAPATPRPRIASLLDALDLPPPAPTLDPRVVSGIHLLRDADAESDIGSLAEKMHLSHSRLTHLFQSEIGAPPAQVRLWTRLRRAIDLIGGGQSITAAAHAAGFADAAHLTRTFVGALGITPGMFRRSEIFAGAPAMHY